MFNAAKSERNNRDRHNSPSGQLHGTSSVQKVSKSETSAASAMVGNPPCLPPTRCCNTDAIRISGVVRTSFNVRLQTIVQGVQALEEDLGKPRPAGPGSGVPQTGICA